MENELVEVKGNNVLCDSRKIAEKFGKRHKNVLRKIDKLMLDLKNLPAQNQATKKIKFPLLFSEESYSYKGQNFRYVKMNKPAYTLLVMGFSGVESLEIKMLFNDAFYLMEQMLLRQSNLEWQREREQGKQIRLALVDEIKDFVDYAIEQGSKNAKHYYATITKLQYKALGLIEKNEKIDKRFRNTLDIMDLHNLLSAEMIARKALLSGINQKLHYKDIFQLAKQRVLQFADIILIPEVKALKE